MKINDFHRFSLISDQNIGISSYYSEKNKKKQNRWISKIIKSNKEYCLRAYKHHNTNISTPIDDEKKYTRVRMEFSRDPEMTWDEQKSATDP